MQAFQFLRGWRTGSYKLKHPQDVTKAIKSNSMGMADTVPQLGKQETDAMRKAVGEVLPRKAEKVV